jgi:hypothetical protein
MFVPFSQAITDALYRFYQIRPIAKLIPNRLDVHVDRTFPCLVGGSARGRQFLTPKDPPRLDGQSPEQTELGRRQGEAAAVNAGREPSPIQDQTVAVDSIVRPTGGLDPGQEGAKTVFEVIPLLFPQRRAAEFAVPLLLRRQQEHGSATGRQPATDLAAYIQGVGIRQVRIQQDDVRLCLDDTGHTGPAVRRRNHPTAGGSQASLQARLQAPGLTDNEHRRVLQHTTSRLSPKSHGPAAKSQIQDFRFQIPNFRFQM